MKVVLLAGGFGTRISEESQFKPKPMIEIGGKPILWHIMKSYSAKGFNEFVICGGYKQQVIKDFFAHYYLYKADVTFDLTKSSTKTISNNNVEPWIVTVADTGLNTMTGGRIKRIKEYVGNEPFLLTYGDGVSDVDLDKLIEHHKKHGKMVTLTAVQPGERFGTISCYEDSTIRTFAEKRKEDGGWINAGFMVVEPEIFNYIKDDTSIFERDVLEPLAAEGKIAAYKHDGYWQCMDTLRDKMKLEELIEKGKAPWISWSE